VSSILTLRQQSLDQRCLVATFAKPLGYVHGSFALLFSELFNRDASNGERDRKRTGKWDTIEQSFLI
jgi:hypothetical protein